MANGQANLNPQQSEALNKIMAVPTKPVPTSSYQVPELTPQIVQAAQTPQVTTPPISVNGVLNPDDESETKKSSMKAVLFVVVAVIVLALYSFFWVKFFGFF